MIFAAVSIVAAVTPVQVISESTISPAAQLDQL